VSLAIDAVILFSAVIIIWSGAHKGFIRSIMGLVGAVASAIAAYAYTPMLSTYIKEKFLVGPITDGIHETLKSLSFDINTDLYNLDRLVEDVPDPFVGILERYNVSIDQFMDSMRGMTGCSESVVREFAEDIATPTSGVIASAIAFIIIFIGVFFVLSIMTSMIDFLFRLPVLKTANTFLGLLFGIAEAGLVVFVLASVLSVLVTGLGSIDPTLFGADVVENTTICKKLLEYNVLTKITDVLS